MVPLPHQTMGDTGGPGIKSFFIFNIIIDKRWFYVNNVCLCVCVCVCMHVWLPLPKPQTRGPLTLSTYCAAS